MLLAGISFYNALFATIVGGVLLYALAGLAAPAEGPDAPTKQPAAAEASAPAPAAAAAPAARGSGGGGAGSAGAGKEDDEGEEVALGGRRLRLCLDVTLLSCVAGAALSVLAYEVRADPWLDVARLLPSETAAVARALRRLRDDIGLF